MSNADSYDLNIRFDLFNKYNPLCAASVDGYFDPNDYLDDVTAEMEFYEQLGLTVVLRCKSSVEAKIKKYYERGKENG